MNNDQIGFRIFSYSNRNIKSKFLLTRFCMQEAFLPAAITVFVLDVAIMMWNFAKNPNQHGGKYEKLYPPLKTLLLPSLFAIYACLTEEIDRFLAGFCLFSWIGDVALLWDGILPTMIGGLFFATAHFHMLKIFNVAWKSVSLFSYIMMIPGLAVHFGHLVPKLSFKSAQSYAIIVYCCILEIGLCSAAATLYQLGWASPRFWMSYFGYFFFVVSDFFLLSVHLNLQKTLRRIEIMGTYIIAEVLLVFSRLI